MFKRHKHSWRLVEVSQGEDLNWLNNWLPCTWLYFACTCTETKIEKRWGDWKMEDFDAKV